MSNKTTKVMNVKDNLINVIRINNIGYISLTDLARYKNPNNLGDVIIKWMSNKSSFDFYCLLEEQFNEDFKLAESCQFKNDSVNQSFTMSPSRWIGLTNAKGFITKRGKYDGGTFAHPDIATDILHLVVLNASMIDNNISQKERLEKLNSTARKELQILVNDKNIKSIEKESKKMIEIK